MVPQEMYRCCAMTPAPDLETGPLGCISLPVQNRIHRSGLVISRPRLQGRIWPSVWQCGCHSREPPLGVWPHEGRGVYQLGTPVFFSGPWAIWKSAEQQEQQRASLEATAHFDLSTSRPGSKGKNGVWPPGNWLECRERLEHVVRFTHVIYCWMLSEAHFDTDWLENPKLRWQGGIPHY